MNTRSIMHLLTILLLLVAANVHADIVFQRVGNLVSDPVERTINATGHANDEPYHIIEHDYATMPNIVCNVINAIYGLGPQTNANGGGRTRILPLAPGVWAINGETPHWTLYNGATPRPLTYNQGGNGGRGNVCGKQYCKKLFYGGQRGPKGYRIGANGGFVFANGIPQPIPGRKTAASLDGMPASYRAAIPDLPRNIMENPVAALGSSVATSNTMALWIPPLTPVLNDIGNVVAANTIFPSQNNVPQKTVIVKGWKSILNPWATGPLPVYFSCDEYPFNASDEGGIGAGGLGVPARRARVNCVPDAEQSVQGGTTSSLYSCSLNPKSPLVLNNNKYFMKLINVPNAVFANPASPLCADFI
jgi:hypothetical protein